MKINQFTLFWLNGKSEVIRGTEFKTAFKQAGYNTTKTLDFYMPGACIDKYCWDKEKRTWILV